MMWWDDGGWGAGDWVVMGLVMGLCMLLLVGGALWAVTALRGGGPQSSEHDSSAERLLDQRFARGEITEDEYLERRSLLRRD